MQAKPTTEKPTDALLSEDESEVRVSKEARKGWEPRPSGYAKADFETDSKAREIRRERALLDELVQVRAAR